VTHTGSKRNHRSKIRRITLMVTPVAALAMTVPLMNQADAATPSEVAADCAANSDKLESCDFVDVQYKKNSLGPNERVSSVTDNCGMTSAASKTFDISVSTTRVIALEDGFVADAGASLSSSLFTIGAKFVRADFNIKRDDKAATASFSRTDTVKPDHLGFFMWSTKRTDVSGYLKATYKDEQNGQKVFFTPKEGGTDVHVFYPQLLQTGAPDGRLWLRNVKCGTPEAKGIQRFAGSLRAEPGIGQGGDAVTDTAVPLSNVAPQ
jgi:hypothetical protein